MEHIAHVARQMQLKIAKMFWQRWFEDQMEIEIAESTSRRIENQSGCERNNVQLPEVFATHSTDACVDAAAAEEMRADWVCSARSARHRHMPFTSVPAQCQLMPRALLRTVFDVSLLENRDMYTSNDYRQLTVPVSGHSSRNSFVQNVLPRVLMARTKQTLVEIMTTGVVMTKGEVMTVVLRKDAAVNQPSRWQGVLFRTFFRVSVWPGRNRLLVEIVTTGVVMTKGEVMTVVLRKDAAVNQPSRRQGDDVEGHRLQRNTFVFFCQKENTQQINHKRHLVMQHHCRIDGMPATAADIAQARAWSWRVPTGRGDQYKSKEFVEATASEDDDDMTPEPTTPTRRKSPSPTRSKHTRHERSISPR